MPKSVYTFLLFLLLFFATNAVSAQESLIAESWAEIVEKKKGTVEVVWSALEPFIYRGKDGQMQGIEAEILQSFFDFIERKYHVRIAIQWREMPSFTSVEAMLSRKKGSYFMASGISITPERKKRIAFIPPYMPDITVLISSNNVPIYKTEADFKNQSSGLKAYTSRNTTYEDDLSKLLKNTRSSFSIVYIKEGENLIDVINKTPNAIGYIDFPIYLKYYEKGSKIKRQFIFQHLREGYSIAMPFNHDWQEPVNAFFHSTHWDAVRNGIIRKYMGSENWNILKDLSGGRESSIFKKENDIQDRKMIDQMLETKKQENWFFLAIVIAIATFLLILVVVGFLYYRFNIYRKNNKTLQYKNEEISQQKAEIEAQKDAIEEKNKVIELAYEQIQFQKTQLEELNESKNRFFSIIAHDLRSPINSLLGFTNLLSNYADAMTPDEVKKISGDLNASLENVLQLIEDLLTWARSQMNKLEFEPALFSLNQLIRDDVEVSGILFQKKEIELVTEIEDNLAVFGDADQVRFILRNLMSNAIKFTNRNGKVKVKAFDKGKFVQVSVSDNGVGIPLEVQKKLFQMDTVQSTKGTDNEQGTGLGLLLCNEFARKNGGEIWVESSEGKGSSFSFTLLKNISAENSNPIIL